MTTADKSEAERPSQASRVHQVYTAHRAGLPPLGHYFRTAWGYRDFAREMSDTQMRAANTNTFLGQAWLVVNPLLLAGVYYLMVAIISRGGGSSFPQITAGLFIFFFISGSMQSCTTSVTAGGSLILNMNFPKIILPMSAVYLNLRRFLPTLIVYAVVHIIWGRPWTWQLLWLPLIIAIAGLTALGLGLVLATLHVYFRDTAQLLPYFIRIWLYLSPVLWTSEFFLQHYAKYASIMQLNPIFSLLGMWSDALVGVPLNPWYLLTSLGWMVLALVGGGLYFISREREFSVRL